MLEIDKNKVQINLGPNVGDIATRYDPPRRGRVNPNGGLQKKPSNIQGDSLLKIHGRPKPGDGLRPNIVNRHM